VNRDGRKYMTPELNSSRVMKVATSCTHFSFQERAANSAVRAFHSMARATLCNAAHLHCAPVHAVVPSIGSRHGGNAVLHDGRQVQAGLCGCKGERE
jgi:hypothetical protein